MRKACGGRAMARPPFFMARREMFEIDRTEVNWEAVRADYMAGG